MSDVQAILDEDSFAEAMRVLDPENLPRAVSGAINKTTAKLRTRAVRHVAEQVAISVKEVRENIGTQKATRSKLEGLVKISQKHVGLIKYGAVQTPRGVVVQMSKTGPSERFSHYFIARMPNGHIGVFSREGRAPAKLVDLKNGRKVYSGLPIAEKFGPSITGSYAGPAGEIDHDAQWAAADLQIQMASQIDRFLALQKADDGDE